MKTHGLEIRFASAHFYHQKNWNDEQNREIFGKCFSPHGHGHDYRLSVEFKEDLSVDSVRKALKDLRELLDHKHLNFDIPEFKNQVPTSENLLLFCKAYLEQKLGPKTPLRLALWETDQIGASIASF